MASKRRGFGTAVAVDYAGNGTFVTVGFTKSVTPPPIEVEANDETDLEDDREDMQPGITKATVASFEGFHDPNDETTHTGKLLDDLAKSKVIRDWRYTYPGGAIDTFGAWIQKLAPASITTKESMTRSCELMTTEDAVRS